MVGRSDGDYGWRILTAVNLNLRPAMIDGGGIGRHVVAVAARWREGSRRRTVGKVTSLSLAHLSSVRFWREHFGGNPSALFHQQVKRHHFFREATMKDHCDGARSASLPLTTMKFPHNISASTHGHHDVQPTSPPFCSPSGKSRRHENQSQY